MKEKDSGTGTGTVCEETLGKFAGLDAGDVLLARIQECGNDGMSTAFAVGEFLATASVPVLMLGEAEGLFADVARLTDTLLDANQKKMFLEAPLAAEFADSAARAMKILKGIENPVTPGVFVTNRSADEPAGGRLAADNIVDLVLRARATPEETMPLARLAPDDSLGSRAYAIGLLKDPRFIRHYADNADPSLPLRRSEVIEAAVFSEALLIVDGTPSTRQMSLEDRRGLLAKLGENLGEKGVFQDVVQALSERGRFTAHPGDPIRSPFVTQWDEATDLGKALNAAVEHILIEKAALGDFGEGPQELSV